MQRAVAKIRERRADGGGGNDRGPIQKRMEFFRFDLRKDETEKQRRKNDGAQQVAEVQRHGDGVAAGFAERGGGDFDEPKNERDGGNFAQGVGGG